MDFVNIHLESTVRGYTGILVIIAHLTAMATYLLCRKGIDCLELARMCFKHVIHKCSVPDNITTDSGKVFTLDFGTQFAPTSIAITNS